MPVPFLAQTRKSHLVRIAQGECTGNGGTNLAATCCNNCAIWRLIVHFHTNALFSRSVLSHFLCSWLAVGSAVGRCASKQSGSGHYSEWRLFSKAVIQPRPAQCPLCAKSGHSPAFWIGVSDGLRHARAQYGRRVASRKTRMRHPVSGRAVSILWPARRQIIYSFAGLIGWRRSQYDHRQNYANTASMANCMAVAV
jgi:hypothetical protein